MRIAEERIIQQSKGQDSFMWIKLISPQMSHRPMDSALKTHMAPPLALLVLGALTPKRHRVTVEDENVECVPLGDMPDLVGITVKVDTAYRANEISNHYRRRGIPVVFGGIHPTVCPELNLEHADAVVIGEAESIWADVLRDVENRSLKRLYHGNRPGDLAQSPVPQWELIAGKNYLYTNTLCVGRGCSWRCDFCYNSAPNLVPGYRAKPLENIVAEIESLGTRHVMFIDDNFIGNPTKAHQLLKRIAPLGLTWHTAVSVDIGHHDDIIDMMAKTGCKSLFIGFETINGANLTTCGKKQNCVHDYRSTITKIHSRGMMVNASLVFGFDGDGPGVFKETMDWLADNKVETMTAHILTPYPGTRFYDRLREERRIIDADLRHYNTSQVVFRPSGMTPDQLREGYLWMYREFYSWKRIWQRLPAAKSQWAAYLAFNLLYRKYGPVTAAIGKLGLMGTLGRVGKSLAYRAPKASRASTRLRHAGQCDFSVYRADQ